jgi:hypothetical protein
MVSAPPLQDALNDDCETSQTAAQDDSDRSSKKRSNAYRLNILPRNDVSEKVRCDLARPESEGGTHKHADKRAARYHQEYVLPIHNVR